jgi:hypothetical protein
VGVDVSGYLPGDRPILGRLGRWVTEHTDKGDTMHVQLSPSWMLTTEHAASSYGIPVLVGPGRPGDAYGPGDILEAYPCFGLLPGRLVVQRLARTVELDDKGRDLVRAFTGE